MAYFTVPFQWNDDSLNNILKNKTGKDNKIVEVYGTISEGSLPHGRANTTVKKIEKEKALQYKKIMDENHINFAYLLNASEYNLDSETTKQELEWILRVFQPNSLTIASLNLMKYIRKLDQKVKINISTIAGTKEIEQLQCFEPVQFSKVVLHHDGNRNLEELKRFVEYSHKHQVEIELMVNESCLSQCPNRQNHYAEIAKGNSDVKFHHWCNKTKVMNPYCLLMANYILPTDIVYYEKLGVRNFKITGRSKPVAWLGHVIESYLTGTLEGNLMDYLAIDPELKAEAKIYIGSKQLNGFFVELMQRSDLNQQKEMCKRKIIELYKNGQFNVNDYVDYEVTKDDLVGTLRRNLYGTK